MLSNRQVGQRIRELREIQHYSRAFFAEKVGITPKFLGDVEAGHRGISANTLSKIASALSVSTDYILFGVESGSQSTEKIVNTLEGMDDSQKSKIHSFIVLVDELLR